MSAQTLVSAVVVLVTVHVVLLTVAYLIYLERKISAYIQDRIGPNRVGFDFGLTGLKKLFRGFGFWGLGQPLADGLKFLLKEDYAPLGADRALFTLAPVAIIIPALIGWAVIPWGGWWVTPDVTLPIIGEIASQRVLVGAANVNIGVIYLLAVASLGVYGVTLGGWASNNKYSLLGGLRATAGMISYEIPLGLAVLAVLLTAGTVMPQGLIEMQARNGWFILAHPIAALLFFVCILAEANRAPFDNAEAEQELVGGYHTEYSSMRFALFFLAEYGHLVTSSAFLILLFFGGYHLPMIGLTSPEAMGLAAVLTKCLVFFVKVLLVICFMIVIRWTLPRIRWDQVMKLAWNDLIPIGIALLVATAAMVQMGWTATWQLLAMNIALASLVILIQPLMPRHDINRRVPMAGSRFCPLPGEVVSTAPRSAEALDDAAPGPRAKATAAVS